MLGGRGKSALVGKGLLNDLSSLGTQTAWGERNFSWPVPPPQSGTKPKMRNVPVPSHCLSLQQLRVSTVMTPHLEVTMVSSKKCRKTNRKDKASGMLQVHELINF